MDSKIGLGFKFDRIKTPDFYRHYIKYNKKILGMIEPKIKNNSIVSDYGAGNGILARDLLKLCRKRRKVITIENIDIDESRFEKIPRVTGIKGDIRSYRTKGRYDSAIARHIMHYLSPGEQLRFLKNAKNNLKQEGFFLLINFVVDDRKSYEIQGKIFKIVRKWKRIVRKDVPTSEKIKGLCKKSGFKIVKTRKYTYKLSIIDFYKNRYKLSGKQVKELQNSLGVKSHKVSQLAVLMQK